MLHADVGTRPVWPNSHPDWKWALCMPDARTVRPYK